MPVNAKSLLGGTGGDPDEDEFVQNDGIQGDEARYCYCNQVSYGEMVACDRDGCTKEWYFPQFAPALFLFLPSFFTSCADGDLIGIGFIWNVLG